MRPLLKLLTPLSLVSLASIVGISWLHAAPEQTMCALTEQATPSSATQAQTHERVYFVGCGGLF